ncbi:TrmH family RNA methyltransferase [Nitratireductor basaltis]|uniref:tRNA/rRNA methyltransferase (SpoU) n=1 Tax=Nitratireductor basaltis TaxID=472175 RepID=A0A084U8Z6_9HYPH|nr:RNA methyltransferase [Nitratireductor basaltis]KFB09432.1 tRNA/rRNA methyltransferase (SpoU) [Nitratireductor basaltis]
MNRELIEITDPYDERIAPYRDIRERDLVGRQGLFIAEGRVVLNVLFSTSRFRAQSLFLRDNRVQGARDLLERVPADIPVYVAGGEIMDEIAGFNIHRGIIAVGERCSSQTAEELLDSLPENALVVALSAIANHDNMGAIFRNAAAFGADAVLLDSDCCDPLYRKAIRVSVGAALKVPFAQAGKAQEMTALLHARGFDVLAMTPQGERDVSEVSLGPRTALLLGAEGPGLDSGLLEQWPTVKISMREDFDSLNVATASAIALHHIWLKR